MTPSNKEYIYRDIKKDLSVNLFYFDDEQGEGEKANEKRYDT